LGGESVTEPKDCVCMAQARGDISIRRSDANE
jgi:hypothetical protein